MPLALTAFFTLVSLFSLFFIIRRYRTATPAQRRQMVFAGVGAGALALAIGAFIYFR